MGDKTNKLLNESLMEVKPRGSIIHWGSGDVGEIREKGINP